MYNLIMNEWGIFGVDGVLQQNPRYSSAGCKDKVDFVQIFPVELSNKLFSYVSVKDLFTCAKCSLSWHQVINDNSQWKLRCIRRGWANATSDADIVHKWNLIKSHVENNDTYRFRTSPVFVLSEVASLRIPQLCDWAVYFRQCFHIQRNWDTGIYFINRLSEYSDAEYDYSMVNKGFDCNGKLMVCGISSGKVIIYNVDGVPKFFASTKIRMEVESVILKSKFLIVLYHTGLIKVFDTDTDKLLNNNRKEEVNRPELNLVYAIRGSGLQSPDGFELILNAQLIPDNDIGSFTAIENEEENDVEFWIRDLFRVDLWMGNGSYMGSDMMIYANENIVILTAVLSRCFQFWRIEKPVIHKVMLPLGYQVIFQSYLTTKKLYISSKKREDDDENYGNHDAENPRCFILVYDLLAMESVDSTNEMINPTNIIPSETMVEEIRSDSQDKRIAFSTQNGVSGVALLENNGSFETLFNVITPSFVDNLTSNDSIIVYHQYDGFLVGINWAGEILYEIEAHTGLVKGLQIFENRLVSGGDQYELYVWNAQTGERLHSVHHQPCRIQHLYVDATKIITVGIEDLPVVVAYW